jgi:hypothetical protein
LSENKSGPGKHARTLRIVVDAISTALAYELLTKTWPTYRKILLGKPLAGSREKPQAYDTNTAYVCDLLLSELLDVVTAKGVERVELTYAAVAEDAQQRPGRGDKWISEDPADIRKNADVIRGYVNDWYNRAGSADSVRPTTMPKEARVDLSWFGVPHVGGSDGSVYSVFYGLATAGARGQRMVVQAHFEREDGDARKVVAVERVVVSPVDHDRLRRDLDDHARVLTKRFRRDWIDVEPYEYDRDGYGVMVWARHQMSVVVRRLRMAGFALGGLLLAMSIFGLAALLVGTEIAKHTAEQRRSMPKIDPVKLPAAVAQNEELLEALRIPEAERFNALWGTGVAVNDDTCSAGRPTATLGWNPIHREDLPVLLLRDGKKVLKEITSPEQGEYIDTDLEMFVPYSYKLVKRTKGWFFLRDGTFHFYGVVSERATSSVSVLPGVCNLPLYMRVRPYVVNVTPTGDPATFTFSVEIRDPKLQPKAYRWMFSDSLYIPERPTPWSQSPSIVKKFAAVPGQAETPVRGTPEILMEDGSVKMLGSADSVIRTQLAPR